MHEFGIATTIYSQVCEEAEKRDISKILSIGIEVGKMAAIVPDALEFSFEAITKGTFLEGVRLVIEEIPFSAKCEECGHIFEVEDYNLICPECENGQCELISGDEILIKRLEVE